MLGDELLPEEVSKQLGLQPTRSYRKGQPIGEAAGKVKPRARIGSWILDRDAPDELTIQDAIVELLNELPDDLAVWSELTSRFRLDLICDVQMRCFNRGFVIAPHVMRMLADRGIELGIDVFYRGDLGELRGLEANLRKSDQPSVE